jgi:hypothetical protein
LFSRVQSVDHGSDLAKDSALIVGVPDVVTAVDIIDMLVEDHQDVLDTSSVNENEAKVVDMAANKV